jgi:hypothetical protein
MHHCIYEPQNQVSGKYGVCRIEFLKSPVYIAEKAANWEQRLETKGKTRCHNNRPEGIFCKLLQPPARF